LKLKNLDTNASTESVYKAADKFNDIVLETKANAISLRRKRPIYLHGPGNVRTDDLNKDDLGDALNYLKEQMVIEVVRHEGKAVGVETPINVELKIEYTEPAVKGDTSGKS